MGQFSMIIMPPDGSALGDIQQKDLREAIYRLFLAESRVDEIAAEDLELLNMWIGRAMAERRLIVSGDCIGWSEDTKIDVDLVSRRVALSAANLLPQRDRRPVRECRGPNCGWLFLDTTRGGHRRWCSEAGCGTRIRVKRFREGKDR